MQQVTCFFGACRLKQSGLAYQWKSLQLRNPCKACGSSSSISPTITATSIMQVGSPVALTSKSVKFLLLINALIGAQTLDMPPEQ